MSMAKTSWNTIYDETMRAMLQHRFLIYFSQIPLFSLRACAAWSTLKSFLRHIGDRIYIVSTETATLEYFY